MTITYFVSDGYNADGAPNPLREVEVIKWPEPDSVNCICRIKYLDDGSECFAPKYSLIEKAARHRCQDENATVVNDRWLRNCPGGPYGART